MFIDSTYLINKDELEEIEKLITCVICDGIINEPIECSLCENNFCKHCIIEWNEKNKTCPFRCSNSSFKENNWLKLFLSDILKFKCEKGCGQIISYYEFNEHYLKTCPNINKIDYRQKFEDLSIEFEKMKVRFEIKNENNKKYKNEIENLIESNKFLKVENEKYVKLIKENISRNNSIISRINEVEQMKKELLEQNASNQKKMKEKENKLLEMIEKLNNEKSRISGNITQLKETNEQLNKINKVLSKQKKKKIKNFRKSNKKNKYDDYDDNDAEYEGSKNIIKNKFKKNGWY